MYALGRYLGLDRIAVGYGLRLALSAWMAFAVAAVLHVQNAFWAAMVTWVVAQNTRGLLLERAFFRVIGTLLGAAFGFIVLHIVGSPYLQLALLGCVVAIGAGVTHVLRGVHSYALFMGGMTAAVVILPSVIAPEHATELAIARVECTLIGVLAVALVMGLTTPGYARQDFYRKVRGLSAEAVAFAARILQVEHGPEAAAFERRILMDISEIDAAAAGVSAGSFEGYRRLRHVDALIATSLDVMAAGRAVRARTRRGEALPEGLIDGLSALSEQLSVQEPAGVELPLEWYDREVVPEVRRLLNALEQLVSAQKALFSTGTAADAKPFGRKAIRLAPQRDWGIARRAGTVAGLATVVAGVLCYWSGWHVAELTALGICIFSMVLGSLPLPHKIAPKVFSGVTVGVLIATGYRFLIQPQIVTTAMLIVSIAPFIVVGGLARASSKVAVAAVDGNMCFMLASQAGMPTTTGTDILGASFALVLAAGLISGGFILLPPRPVRHAQIVANRIQRDIERLMRRPSKHDSREQWQAQTARQILRLMMHLGRAGKLGDDAPEGLLAVLNLGHAIVALQDLRMASWHAESRRAQAGKAYSILAEWDGRESERMARILDDHAKTVDDDDVRRAVELAADALKGGLEFFAFVQDRV